MIITMHRPRVSAISDVLARVRVPFEHHARPVQCMLGLRHTRVQIDRRLARQQSKECTIKSESIMWRKDIFSHKPPHNWTT
jgi:hypothetical protein